MKKRKEMRQRWKKKPFLLFVLSWNMDGSKRSENMIGEDSGMCVQVKQECKELLRYQDKCRKTFT